MKKEPLDRSRSFAILVGTSTYASDSGLRPLPAARRSLDAMEQLLKSDLCGWTDDRMLILHDEKNKHDLLARITDVLQARMEQITDTVLFYYVGHGLLIDGGEKLGLAMSDTKDDPLRKKQSSLLLNEVREQLRHLTNATQVEILDCCYAGTASNTQGAANALQDKVSRAVQDKVSRATQEYRGSRYTVTASRRNEEALYQLEDGGLTYFTGYLAEIVTHGIEGAPAHLAAMRIFPELQKRFRRLALAPIGQPVPMPTQLVVNEGGEFPFARNAAYQEHSQESHPPVVADLDPEHRRLPSRRAMLAAGVAAATGLGIVAALWPDSGPGGSQEKIGSPVSPGADRSSLPPTPTIPTTPTPTPTPTIPTTTPTQVTDATALGAPLKGFEATVEAVAFASSGTLLAGGSYDHTIHLWDVANPATPLQVGPYLTGDTDSVNAVAFSPDGRTLVGASWDKTIRLWNVASPLHAVAIGRPVIGTDKVNTVAFSPNGKTLASGGDDRTVRMWNIADPPALAPACPPLTDHTNAVNAVAFSPDGTILASAGWDFTIRLWEVSDPARTRAAGRPLSGHTYSVAAVAFSPDGKTLASAGWDNTVRLWDVSNPAQATEIGLPLTGHTDHVQGIAYSPDGRTVASGSWDKTIRLWDVSDPTRAKPIGSPLIGHTGQVASVAFHPMGKILASGSTDSTIRLWQIE